MANQFSLPFNNVVTIKKSGNIEAEFLMESTKDYINDGICIILKEDDSNDLEGGYLFNFISNSEGLIDIYSINSRKMVSLNNYEELEKFINHHSGRNFNKEQWLISQQLNFLLFNEEIAPN